MRNFWLMALPGLLVGMSDTAAASSLAERPVDARPIIQCFGDSLTAGFGLDPGQSYPSILQHELTQRGYNYEVQNLGIDGNTTQDGLARLPMALAAHPRIIILELGANDGLRGQPVQGIEKSLAEMIQAIQKAKVKIALAGITLPPNYGQEYVRRFSAIYPELAKKYKLALIPFLLEGVAGNSRLMQQDGLHPTAEGARIVAMTVLKTVQPMLKK